MQQFIEYAVNILYEEYEEGNPKVLNFIQSRNLKYHDMENYGIGYIRPNNAIPKFIRDNIEYYKEIRVINHNGELTVCDRIIIPIKDIDGEFVMISCRDASNVSGQKYLTLIQKGFSKLNILDGFYDNLNCIRSANEIILVEGQFDKIAMMQAGVKNVAAISGRIISDFHIDTILNISNNVRIVLGLDNDTAGRETILKYLKEYPSLFSRTYFFQYDCDTDTAKDPDEYIHKFGISKLLSLKKPLKYFVNVETMQINNQVIFFHDVISKCYNIRDIIPCYYMIKEIYPDIADSFYYELLKKKLKTFENVGNFCYYAFHHKKRISYMIERYCAMWFVLGHRNRVGRYDKFDFIELLKDCKNAPYNCISNFTKFNDLEELGEVYEEPIYFQGEIMGLKISTDFTDRLLRRASEIYIRLKIKWIGYDRENKNREFSGQS